MKAAVLYGKEDIRYTEWTEPRLRPGCVKVQVKACGICGSDIPRVLGDGAHFYPIVLGHEFSGIVTEAAEDTDNIRIGDHVAGIPLLPCMECADCLTGSYSQCRHYSFIGSREQGAFAEYVVLPARNVIQIDERIPFEQAAMFEPCTVALHGLKVSGYQGGQTVAILGGGTVGLFALQWAKLYGARQTVVLGRSKEHLAVASAAGADHVVSTREDQFFEQAMKLTKGHGYDYVYETAGSTETMKLAFKLAANRGHVCFIGTPTEDLCFSPGLWEQLNRKEFSLTGSWMSCSAPFPGTEWSETAHFFETGKIRVVPGMIHARYSFREVEAAFKEFKTHGNVRGRMMLIHG
ncbi:MAG: galactitol-1-phosphate 5-dehydrogenase [Lachnospiraceae bacterium]|nr:galactitol-1-phosphate 5-dehydrogenase [Lachnospiraceae bacterium]